MATASTNCVSEVTDVLDCSICLEKLKVPKYLPCLHTFCETCIQTYIKSTAAYTDQTQQSEFWINCPLCRTTVTCTDKDVTIDSWAKILPLNNLIFSLMDSNNQRSGQKTKVCTCCEREGESSIAKFWCKQCSDALCEACKSFHSKFRQSITHEVVCLESINELDISLPEMDEPCPFHSGKYYEVYCLDHRKNCCSVCFATQHRLCSDVLSIEEVSRRQAEKSGAETMMGNLSEIAEMVDKAIKEKIDNVQAIELEQETELSDIASAVDDIKHLLDILYHKFKQNVKVTHDEQKSKLLAINEELKCFKKTVSNDCKLLNAVITQGNAKQKFLTLESVRRQLMDQFSRLASHLKTDKELHLRFTRNGVLQSITGMQNLVDIDVKPTHTKYHGEISNAIEHLDRECLNSVYVGVKLSEDPFGWKADRTLVINTTIAGEYGSDINGGTFLSDGKLVLTDGKNNKLKVYDTTGNIYTSHRMIDITYNSTSKPYDVTRSSEAQMFFVTHNSVYNRMRVSLCELTVDISFVRTFQAPDGVTGISYAGDVLVLRSASHVYTVSSNDGTIICKVCTDILCDVPYVAASSKSNRLVYTDGSSVVCRTLQMEEIFRYTNKIFHNEYVRVRVRKKRATASPKSEPTGVAFDLKDNIYICDHKSRDIIQIKQNGSQGQALELNFKSVKKPCSIGFQPDGKTFFVGDSDNGYVEVHKLKRTTA